MIQLLVITKVIPHYLFPLLWAGLIFGSSSIPSDSLPDVEVLGLDKVVHVLIYLVLCGLIYRSLALQTHFRVFSTNALLSSFLLTILYGVTDEFHQSFVPGRHASLLDLVADSFGALLFASWVFVRRKERNGGR